MDVPFIEQVSLELGVDLTRSSVRQEAGKE
jgi:hypothetical protein